MKIYHIPCLQDNYSYLIVDESIKEGAVVDPVEPQKVLEAANSHGVNLKLVLPIHHHCHTKGHISYYVTGKENENPAVFIGDILSVNINEFLRPADGEAYYAEHGRGRSGRGPRVGYRNNSNNAQAPSIEDPGHFPTLSGN